ncbi:hypothetical protein GFL39_26415 [Rhizobium leguminosarum bv. viciae]|uniref:hypothetical protein n=1 Tax=Rhizobium leguminosarum TaxID=384 RepID=UPI0014427029|nr:hypothetical protein [Rhizobium leguminosarum]NKL08407.1 hypothetical protein [Rhizobium leguminosarum bv. viciae]
MSKKNTAKNAPASAAELVSMEEFFSQAAGAVADMGKEAEEIAAAELAAQAAAEEAARLAAEEAAKLAASEGGQEGTGQEPATNEDPATDGEPTAPTKRVEGVLKEMKAEFEPEAKEGKKAEIVMSFDDRIAFEKAQPGLSSKMIPNLEAEQKKMATIGAAGLFLAMDIDPGFINREVSTGSRFNVYALQKVNDLIVALDGGFMQNAINKAIVQSLFNFRDAGIPFTGNAALAAVSDKVKADRAITKHLVRHTVSANTASTQKSSTMTALKTLGIVENTGARGNEVWTLTDTPATRRLEEIVRGKAAA